MNSELKKLENNVATLEITVPADKFEEGMQRAYKKNAHKFNIPGFRKGKAPRVIVERYYGEGVLYEDAIEYVFPEAFDKAVKDHGIEPVSLPSISEIKQIGKGSDLVMLVEVTVKPEVTLGDYKGIEIKKVEYNVTDEDVEKELEYLRNKNARLINVEDRGIEKGDIVNISFKGYIDGVPFEGGSAENYILEIGSGRFIQGFEDQLIGAKVGDEVKVNVTFPEDYPNEELKGKKAEFEVKINNIRYKELPELDDEFAKDVSEFDTLEDLKKDIREKLIKNAELAAKRKMEDEVIKKVVENSQVDIPDVMVENEIDNMISDFEHGLLHQGLTFKDYLSYTNIPEKEFRDSLREEAKNRVKTFLVLEKISKVENIEANEEEINAELENMSKRYNIEVEKLRENLNENKMDYIRENIIFRKTVEFLMENSIISE